VIRAMVVAFIVLPIATSAAAQCFDPLSKANSMSNHKSDWDKLEKFSPEVQEEGVVRVLSIKEGIGPINRDFYSITFRKHSTKSLSAVFLEIRQHFNFFAHRQGTSLQDESSTYFLPYRGSAARDDRLSVRNKELWEAENPKRAVMSFVLDNHTPALAFAATWKGMKIVLEQGDVVVTCAEASDAVTQFIFTTVYTEKDQYHPVSGNRGFGVRDNGDGTWTFYTMGVDRETALGTSGTIPYWGNVALKLGFPDRGIPPGPDAVFYAGDKFWRDFFSNLTEYLDKSGMTVDPASFVRNSKRYPYP
jgi:hypothetical protein